MKMNRKNLLNKILIDKQVLSQALPIAEKIGLPYTLVDNLDTITGSKDTVLFTSKKGGFVKPCPCSKDSVSCGYYNINLVEGCFFNCSYCILQLYLKDRPITVYTNLDSLFSELDTLLSSGKFIRIGTGELGDSLCLEEYTGYAAKLIEYFNDKNALFEVKTKDSRIESLLNCKHNGKTVISFSMNPENLAATEETGASTPDERIRALQTAQDAGYPVGLHFDPVILYDGWEKDYSEFIKQIGKELSIQKIKWISIGLLRFPFALKPIILFEQPTSKILAGELIRTEEGKIRYFAGLRKKAYSFMLTLIKKTFPEIPVYFCMETQEIQKAFHAERTLLRKIYQMTG